MSTHFQIYPYNFCFRCKIEESDWTWTESDSRQKCLKKQFLRNNWWNYYFFKHCTNVLFYIFVETCHFAKWILMAQHLYFVDCSKLTFRNHFNSNLKFLFLPNCILSYKKCWKHGLSPIYKWANRTNILSIMMVLDTNVKI